MEKSESIIELSGALNEFHGIVGKIAKDAKNPFFKSDYATLSHILEEIHEPLQKSGLVITQWPEGSSLVTLLIHAKTGQYLQSTYEMPIAKQNDPQAVGSSISYARRYAISSILSLNISDDDGNAAAGKGKAAPQQQPDKPWLSKGEKLDKAMEYLRGGGTLHIIEAKYRISKEVREILNKVIEQTS